MSDENSYELIGRAHVAWSDVELMWYLLFLTLCDASRSHADAVYISPRQFALERQFSLNLSKVALVGKPDLAERVVSLFNRTNKLSSERNAVAHTKFIKSSDRDVTSLGIWAVGKTTLTEESLPADLKKMETNFSKLSDELLTLLFALCAALGKEPPSIET